MKSCVAGFVSAPSILTTRPRSTVTSSVQESGQSSGQAVRTVDRPQLTSAGLSEEVRAMGDYCTAITVAMGSGPDRTGTRDGEKNNRRMQMPPAAIV